MTSGLGHIKLGADFAAAASHLFNEKVRFYHSGPIEYLYAHSLELFLKGALLECGASEEEVEKYGHKILELYDRAKNTRSISHVILDAEKTVLDNWRSHLRTARDKHEEKIWKFGLIDPEHPRDLGVLNNADIGNELPELRQQVIWLSERHSVSGGLLRYQQTRMDSPQKIQVFGLDDDVVTQSLEWGCQAMSRSLIELSRSGGKT